MKLPAPLDSYAARAREIVDFATRVENYHVISEDNLLPAGDGYRMSIGELQLVFFMTFLTLGGSKIAVTHMHLSFPNETPDDEVVYRVAPLFDFDESRKCVVMRNHDKHATLVTQPCYLVEGTALN